MLLAGTTEASPLKRRVDLTEVDLSGDNCSHKNDIQCSHRNDIQRREPLNRDRIGGYEVRESRRLS